MSRQYISENPVFSAILLFVLLFGVVIWAKPKYLFLNDGSVRTFGIGYRNKTIFPIWLFAIILGILCYVFIAYYVAFPSRYLS